MDNVLQSYLVKLGFATDTVGLARFNTTLRDAAGLIRVNAGSIAADLLKMQGGIVSAFAATGAAALGLADKVAMADQEFRLFGLRMYMTQSQAKTLKIAMDALGQPLENIAWDSELRGRFNQLVDDQKRLQEGLGPDFEEQMRRIRDIRFELTRMQVEGQYLGMNVVENLMKAFGTGPDDLLARLQKINDWVIENMPAISQKIATGLLPVWKDMKNVLGDTVDMAKEMAVAFSNIVGLISGNTALEGTAFNFEKLAGSIETVVHWMAVFAEGITHAEELLLHFLNATTLGLSGNFGAAKGELQEALRLANAGTGAIIGAAGSAPLGVLIGGALGIEGGPLGIAAGAGLGGMLGTGLGAGLGAGAGAGIHALQTRMGIDPSFAPSESDVKLAIVTAAQSAGIDPRLALAVAQVESGYRQYGKDGKVLTSNAPNSHAAGIFQLEPGTAREMGVDANDIGGNIQGGVGYLRNLLSQYHGDAQSALEHYYGSQDSGVNADYASKVMNVEAGLHIDTLAVTVGSGNPSDIRSSVLSAVQEAQQRQTQRNLVEFQSMGWSYGS
ncbi:MAG TPA: transglycosylase SLT domain-containing protein [Acidobacteriaceae bacterium]|nr:transglycosylase SLT domain-containing protein [Acidobacteriaceae bacterium]